jgi:mannose-6-phosphate isomerase-like protein (cupin superfamily)
MIRTPDAMPCEVRPAMRGGTGEVTVQHLFTSAEFGGKVRLCARLTIPPGASIGMHPHEGEDEVYLVTRGSGMLTEEGGESRVTTGTAILTGKGASHAVRNDTGEPLEILAFIVQY